LYWENGQEIQRYDALLTSLYKQHAKSGITIYAEFSSPLQQYFRSQTSSISYWCQEGKLEPSGMLPNSFPTKSRFLTFQELEDKSL